MTKYFPAAIQRFKPAIWITLSITALMAMFFPALAAKDGATESAVRPKIEIDRPVVLTGSSEPIFVLVRFNAPDILPPDQAERPAVNLALVLDRSGSMEEKGKITYLKQAAKMAVERLTPRDYLSIVEYDDRITVMWPSQRVESTFPIARLIDELQPRGSTDLVGGMMRGADEVQGRMRTIDSENTINRVLLLSDGLANEGVTDSLQIRRLVRSARESGVRISTMGLGRDYDEDLMQAIAENAGGSYYYIEHPNQMARIFEQELNTLFTTVARDVRFSFDAGDSVADIRTISFAGAEDASTGSFDMENFYGGESRTLLLRIEVKDGAFDRSGDNVRLGQIDFSYNDVATGQRQTFFAEVAVNVSDNAEEVAKSINHDVTVEANLFEVERKHKEAVASYEAGNVEEAKAQLEALENDMRQVNATLDDVRLANKIEALSVEQDQMTEAAADEEVRSAYLKSTKQRLYKAQQGKRALYMLQQGDKGYEVERLQTALKEEGYYQGEIDGIYDEDVKAAVESYQQANALTVDGMAGPTTMKELSLY